MLQRLKFFAHFLVFISIKSSVGACGAGSVVCGEHSWLWPHLCHCCTVHCWIIMEGLDISTSQQVFLIFFKLLLISWGASEAAKGRLGLSVPQKSHAAYKARKETRVREKTPPSPRWLNEKNIEPSDQAGVSLHDGYTKPREQYVPLQPSGPGNEFSKTSTNRDKNPSARMELGHWLGDLSKAFTVWNECQIRVWHLKHRTTY